MPILQRGRPLRRRALVHEVEQALQVRCCSVKYCMPSSGKAKRYTTRRKLRREWRNVITNSRGLR
jgi:hypothetical protein